jgi:hypothetical protein
LLATREEWDHPGTPTNIRENFLKIIHCGTIALGAEVYSSGTERKLVYHTCKSRFCTSCGQRATLAWQQDLEAILPDLPYVGITLTMPRELWSILQDNRHLLHGMPAMAAEAIQQWVKARYGVRVLLIVVQHTFGGFLNFYPHLHVMVSEGGLQESKGRWIAGLEYGKRGFVELMQAWPYAVIAYLAEALKGQVLTSELSAEELTLLFFYSEEIAISSLQFHLQRILRILGAYSPFFPDQLWRPDTGHSAIELARSDPRKPRVSNSACQSPSTGR